MKVCAVKGTPYSFGGGVGDNNVYSTEETRIGTYLDKPLYRRMFNIKTPNSTGSFSRVLTFDSDVVPVLYDCYFAQGSQYCKLPQPTGNTFTSMQVFSTGPAYVTIRCQSAEHTGKNGVFILEYTKTTDETETTVNAVAFSTLHINPTPATYAINISTLEITPTPATYADITEGES